MPNFDIVSELDLQEVRNAVDQANREATTRFDFKNTDSHVEFSETELVLTSSTEDRLKALYQVLEEKLVRREVSLKALEAQKVEEASKGTRTPARRPEGGDLQEVGKSINRLVKDLGLKGVRPRSRATRSA